MKRGAEAIPGYTCEDFKIEIDEHRPAIPVYLE